MYYHCLLSVGEFCSYFIILFFSLCSVGVVFAYISNQQLNDSIRNFDNTVNTALNSSLNFVDDVQMVGTYCAVIALSVFAASKCNCGSI